MKHRIDKQKANLFHVEVRYEGCNPRLLNNKVWIEGLLRNGAREARMRLLQTTVHKFRPQGITGYALLSESHISIHTWPEYGLGVVDIFTCRSEFVEKAMRLFEKNLGASRKTISTLSPEARKTTLNTRQKRSGKQDRG